jgi:hypothetical protein
LNPKFVIYLTQHEDGLISACADMVGEGEEVSRIGLEIMSSLKLASMGGANIYVSPSFFIEETH